MPIPRKDESKKDFLDRCIPELIAKENRKPDQAAAICNSIFETSIKKENK